MHGSTSRSQLIAWPTLGSSLTNPWKPTPSDLREICRIRRILAQKPLFDDASDHEGEDKSSGDRDVQSRKRTKHEGEEGNERTGVNRVPHKAVRTSSDQTPLRRNEADIPAKAQQRGNNDNRRRDGETVSEHRRGHRDPWFGISRKTKCRVRRDEGQKPVPGIGSYPDWRRSQSHYDYDHEELDAEKRTRKVHVAHHPAAVQLDDERDRGDDGDGLVDPRNRQYVHEVTLGHWTLSRKF